MNFYTSIEQSIDTYINKTVYGSSLTATEGIDLRQEIIWILYGNGSRLPKGHWVIYRRYDRSKTSIYYSPTTHEGVGGPAYEYTDVLYRTRSVPIAFKGNTIVPIKAGIAIENKYLYYFDYTVLPKRGDHIIELTITDHTTTPTISTSIMSDRYLITNVHPYRLENGNVQYFSVQAEFDEIKY